MKQNISPFKGIKIGWLKLDQAIPSLSCDGRMIDLNWKSSGKNGFSADLDFGVLTLKITAAAKKVRIGCSLKLNGTLPEKVIFSPLQFSALKPDHAFFCGEKMGRAAVAKFPVKETRSFEGRYYCALTRKSETVIVTTPLAQSHDNYFRGTAEAGSLSNWRLDFELLHFDPPRRIEFDPITLQCGNALEILEQYGEDSAEVKHDFSKPPEYGWNSWDYYRWTITEDEVMKNAEFIAADPVLKKYVKRIIVDDGWQYCYGEWEANPNFPGGMKKLAQKLRKLGFKPGLWLAPSIIEPQCRIAQWDYDMLACSEGGQPCLGFHCVRRYGFVLDPTVPKTQKFLTELFDRYAGMGYEYFKLDFLASTMTAKRFHDRSVPRSRILRMLMEPICRGVAGRAELLGCNYHFYNGNTFVNSVRVGGDIHSRWNSIRHNTVSVAGLFWANKRLWINDPDFALCRCMDTSDDPDIQRLKPALVFCHPEDAYNPDFEAILVSSRLNEQKVLLSLVLMTGGAVNLSDNMPLLKESGVELARKVLAAESGYGTRPLDLFERELPVYWTQKLKKGGRVLVINWEDEPQEIPLDWKRLAPGASEVKDFWTSRIEKCAKRVCLEPHSCKLWEF